MAWTLRRPAARAVLLDQHGRVFLMRASDPIDPHKAPWWEIPGGGLDPGEDFAECARRELWEEAGFADAEVGPCIWTQHVEFGECEARYERYIVGLQGVGRDRAVICVADHALGRGGQRRNQVRVLQVGKREASRVVDAEQVTTSRCDQYGE